MIDNQHSEIRRLRQSGVGYTKIAQTLSISVNTVKAYCRRNGLAGTCLISSVEKPDTPYKQDERNWEEPDTPDKQDEHNWEEPDVPDTQDERNWEEPDAPDKQSASIIRRTGQFNLISDENRGNSSDANSAKNVEIAGFCSGAESVENVEFSGFCSGADSAENVEVAGCNNYIDSAENIELAGFSSGANTIENVEVAGYCSDADSIENVEVVGCNNDTDTVENVEVVGCSVKHVVPQVKLVFAEQADDKVIHEVLEMLLSEKHFS